MIEKIKQVYKDWKNCKTNDTFFLEHEDEIDRANLHVLRAIPFLIAVIAVLTGLSPVEVNHRIFTFVMYAIVIIGSVVITILTRKLIANDKATHKAANYLICSYVFVTGIFTVYIGTIAMPDMISTWFQIFIICVACMFIITPMQYLKFALAFEVLFLFMTFHVKMVDVAISDTANSLVTLVIAIIIQWEIMRTRVKEILSKSELKMINEKLKHTNNTDELTGVASRRNIMEILDEYMECCHNGEFHLGGIIFDVDYFKEYNDTYGHQQGDEALRQTIGAVKRQCDAIDIKLGRVGGEEFLAVWLCDDISNADEIAEDIRAAVEDEQIFHQSSKVSPFLTISVGGYMAEKGAVISAKEFYARVDKSLYMAKEDGRNRVCMR